MISKKDIPYGKTCLKGRLKLVCSRCNHEWIYTLGSYGLDNSIDVGEYICEGMGMFCPSCKKISTHRVQAYAPKNIEFTEIKEQKELKPKDLTNFFG